MASTRAVLPEPTGPPMPIRVVFFIDDVPQFMNMRTCALDMHCREDVESWGRTTAMSARSRVADVARTPLRLRR